jgi:CheY-like chemotaxis protein
MKRWYAGKPTAKKSPAEPRPVILYVEDDPANLLVVRERLESEYEVLLASNDVECCAMVRAQGERFACILMDIQLQGATLNGIQLTRLIRGLPIHVAKPGFAEDLPVLRTPIIYLTAYGSQYADRDLAESGANHVMSKPVNFARLSLALTQVRLRESAGGLRLD